ncbi:MAG: hypothetical protein MUC88_21805 [Planctomycetes bacterium]|nr:hypothetical protein [Planctomycetota bacterium]
MSTVVAAVGGDIGPEVVAGEEDKAAARSADVERAADRVGALGGAVEGQLLLDIDAADTRLLQDAAVDNYQTLGAGLSLRSDRVSLHGGYSSWNAGVGLAFGL